jgi:L-ribulose-5-phosphate 3-epimerase
MTTRRDFLAAGAAATVLPWWSPRGQQGDDALCAQSPRAQQSGPAALFRISLAQWSLNRELFSQRLDHLDFARVAREDFGLEAIEYVNTFFKTRARDAAYLAEMNRRASDHGVYQHLIMVDGEGDLGDPDATRRAQAVENHIRWLEAARDLGCATIRVNAASKGTFEEQQQLAADGLRRLCERADPFGVNVIVENHGGLSSRGDWLAGVMRRVDHPRCGTLPDFGNFYEYDRYQGVAEMMPYAKAVSAKSHDFDEQGNETTKDYPRLLKIVLDAGFHGWIGIEYEGDRLPEREGIRRTLQLLERLRIDMSR